MYRTWNQLLVCVFFYQQVNIINKVELFIFLKGVEHCNTIHAIDVTALGYDRRATFVTKVNTTIKRNLTFQIWTSISFFLKIMDRTQQKKKKKEKEHQWKELVLSEGNKDFACSGESIIEVLLFPFPVGVFWGKNNMTRSKTKMIMIYCKYFDGRL